MKWLDPGLNIFLSVKVSDLPPDLFFFTPEQKNKTLCLVGHGGKSLWEALPRPLNLDQHPIDYYTIQKIQLFAKEYLMNDCEILYPLDAYTLPLQKIGRFLNLCAPSPIGQDICDEFGLWFAFRGVFLTSNNVYTEKIRPSASQCTRCIERPCLLEADQDEARLSCPVKTEHQYSKEQILYHKKALTLI